MSGRVGGLEFEIGADENEYRRDKRFVAMADVSVIFSNGILHRE